MVKLNIAGTPEIREYENFLAIRILDRNVTKIRCQSLRFKTPRPSPNRTGKMRQCPVLAATNNLLRVRIDD